MIILHLVFFYGWKLQAAVNQNGEVYVMDQMEDGSSTVQIFSSSGVLKQMLGSFRFADNIAQDFQDKIYTIDRATYPAIRIYNANGTLESQFGMPGPADGQFLAPITIKLDRTGNIFVLECNDNWARIQKFSNKGKFLAKYDDFGSFIGKKELLNLALDMQGNMYVTDYYGSSIRKLDSSGKFLKRMIPLGTGNGQIYLPKALDVDVKGNIYVSDFNGERVQKFTSRFALAVALIG